MHKYIWNPGSYNCSASSPLLAYPSNKVRLLPSLHSSCSAWLDLFSRSYTPSHSPFSPYLRIVGMAARQLRQPRPHIPWTSLQPQLATHGWFPIQATPACPPLPPLLQMPLHLARGFIQMVHRPTSIASTRPCPITSHAMPRTLGIVGFGKPVATGLMRSTSILTVRTNIPHSLRDGISC